ncbi:ketosynthase chain-length factor [Streptomyces sp. NPDC054884]|uniref:ketosynthase chain-length factor n=1 Tax=Streptomyces sp. ME08-AFT2 TaxID=3028683 RepID=UPI0029AE8724|nr:ketosynthase chain-length factor [Streptomyces sp. ME08-AFT2]MDX3312028.1 ketosynthase chain-length factor [Streptomyces sp. ME08-AFT2]
MTRRAVVTGIGIAAPNGLGPTSYWRALMAGQSGIRRVTKFDISKYRCKLGGEIPDFVPDRHLQDRILPQSDHITRLSLVATDWALRQAGVRGGDVPTDEMGVVTAASGGGYEFGQRELAKLHHQGPEYVSAYQSFAWFYAVNTGQISIRHKMHGPGAVVISEQAGGIDAIGHARRQLRDGANLMLTGGIDSTLCPWAWVAHQATGRISRSSDPTRAYLPFDERAGGYVPGEGGAIMVLETPESAKKRLGTTVFGEIAGYASTFDPGTPGRPPGLKRAIEMALGDAGMDASDIDVVFADAVGEAELDQVEAEALKEVFGPHGVPVAAPKTMTGRLFAGGASLDVATALLSMFWSAIPPAVGVREAVPEYEMDLVVGEPRQGPIRSALIVARGHGGFNSAMVVRQLR